MIIKLIHNNKIGAYAFMLLLIILFWIKPLLAGVIVDVASFKNAMPLWNLFKFTAHSAWLGFVFSLVLAIIITLFVTRFNSRYALLSKQTALLGFVFILLVAGVSKVQQFNPSWIACLFLIIGLEFLFQGHNYRKAMRECFLASFWLSVGSLVSYKVALLFPLVFILMITLRLINIKTFLAALIGLVLPWLFLLGYALTWGSIAEYNSYLQFSWDKIYEVFPHTAVSLGYLITLAFIFILALFSVIGAYGTKKIYTRKQYQVFIFSALYIIGVELISGLNFSLMPMLAVPLSILIAHLIDNIRSSFWQNTLLIGLAVVTIVGQFLM
ncbi:DUF6427 family protein [Labilibacter marinus]|uniref:DUF6427 family protein n=1 Tax=Labilibacter marinus TaxID=1477105 RepID=UPI00094F56BD|nr:DUF6427 family protein [Labilibacter marinus]